MKILTIWMVLLLGASRAWAQGNTQGNMNAETQRNLTESKEAASRALATFQEIGKQKNFKALGFDSAEEMSGAILGEPIAVMMVGLDDLRKYQPGTDPESIVKPIAKVIYPVSVEERVRSSIVMEKGKEGWEAAQFGGANFARLVTAARDHAAQTTSQNPNAFFVVQVPALNAYFIGYRMDGKLMLSSVIDDPKLNLRTGNPQPAEQVLTELAKIARQYNGLPM